MLHQVFHIVTIGLEKDRNQTTISENLQMSTIKIRETGEIKENSNSKEQTQQ
jgi:hypothetical protein